MIVLSMTFFIVACDDDDDDTPVTQSILYSDCFRQIKQPTCKKATVVAFLFYSYSVKFAGASAGIFAWSIPITSLLCSRIRVFLRSFVLPPQSFPIRPWFGHSSLFPDPQVILDIFKTCQCFCYSDITAF